MAVIALFGKIRRAIGTTGIIGDALAGSSARFVGQAGTAIHRAAAIVVPNAAQFAQRRTCCRHARRNALAGSIAKLIGRTGTAIHRAAAIVVPNAAQFAQ